MFKRHVSFANGVSLMALFVALGGSSYAAIKLGTGTVKARNIASNAVSSRKVKDHSLLARDFRAGQLPAGERGLAGAPGSDGSDGRPGAPGAAGSALGYALIRKCGGSDSGCDNGYRVDEANSHGVDNDHFHHPVTGVFCLNNNLEFNQNASIKLVSKNVTATVGESSVPMFAQATSALAPSGDFSKPDVGADCPHATDHFGPNNAKIKVYGLNAGGSALQLADPDEIFVVFN